MLFKCIDSSVGIAIEIIFFLIHQFKNFQI